MTRRNILHLLATSAATLLTQACGRPESRLKFRLTLEVATPGGIRQGSSVLELIATPKSFLPLPGDHSSMTVLGDTPFVDLGGLLLFAVLENDGTPHDMYQVVVRSLEGGDPTPPLAKSDDIFRSANELHPSVEVPREEYPRLVTFERPGQFMSVREVDPSNLGTVFGAGFFFSRMIVQIVGEDFEVMSELGRRFPWVAKPSELRLEAVSGKPGEAGLGQMLGGSNFTRGKS